MTNTVECGNADNQHNRQVSTMARRRPKSASQSSEKEKVKRYAVTLDPDLVRKVGVIASAYDTSIPDWVNNRIRLAVETELPKALRLLGIDIPE